LLITLKKDSKYTLGGEKKIAKIFKYTLEKKSKIFPIFFLILFFWSYERKKKKKKHCKEPTAVVL
jgi:hypothetical protein